MEGEVIMAFKERVRLTVSAIPTDTCAQITRWALLNAVGVMF